MSYSIKTLAIFDKQVKHLSKKYPSFKDDFSIVIKELRENPTFGKMIANNCYKIRFSIKSKGKGKSGGARLITHFLIEKDTIYLLSIYDKSERETIKDKDIFDMIKNIE